MYGFSSDSTFSPGRLPSGSRSVQVAGIVAIDPILGEL